MAPMRKNLKILQTVNSVYMYDRVVIYGSIVRISGQANLTVSLDLHSTGYYKNDNTNYACHVPRVQILTADSAGDNVIYKLKLS